MGDQILDSIGVSDVRRLMLYFSNTIDLQAQPSAINGKLIILCGCRILFRPEHNPTLSKLDFKIINGYSNEYWGWGFEDDDLLKRCESCKSKVS